MWTVWFLDARMPAWNWLPIRVLPQLRVGQATQRLAPVDCGLLRDRSRVFLPMSAATMRVRLRGMRVSKAKAVSASVPAAARAGEIRPQPWRWSHPRVLVEHPDEAQALAITQALRFAGYAVAVCAGPKVPEQCPLCGFGDCATAHDADLVVSCLGADRDVGREVVQALRTRCPSVPLLVEVPQGAEPLVEDSASLLPTGATPEQIVSAAQRLLGELLEGPPSDA